MMATVSPLDLALEEPALEASGKNALSITSASSSDPWAHGRGSCREWDPHVLGLRAVDDVAENPSHPPARSASHPFRQASHLPQEVMHEINTRSPALKVEKRATASTTPTPSCRESTLVTVAGLPS